MRGAFMANKPRALSEFDFYHVMTRGVGRMVLFEDAEDCMRYLGAVVRYSADLDMDIYAWCLMDNHVHMVVRAAMPVLSGFMRKLDTWHARYFNDKYDHVGHVYQNSFKSVAIHGEVQLLEAIRYVNRNPIVAGLVASCLEYPWSGYRECLGVPVLRKGFVCDAEKALGLFGSQDAFTQFHAQEGDDEADGLPADADAMGLGRDERARSVIEDELGCEVAHALGSLPRPRRNECLKRLKGKGVSVRQVERICGVSRGVVQRVWGRADET